MTSANSRLNLAALGVRGVTCKNTNLLSRFRFQPKAFTPISILSQSRIQNQPGFDSASAQIRRFSSDTKRALSNNAAAAAPSVTDDLDWVKNLRGGEINEKLTGRRDDNWWWTGMKPTELDPNSDAVGEHGGIHCLPQLCLQDVSGSELQAYFDNSWMLTEVLFSALQGDEAFMRPPYHSLRHPLIFYYGHPATFYTNKLRVAGLIDAGINAHFEEIFEVGVDEMRWDDISTLQKDWPCVSEVHEYRQQVYQLVSKVIADAFGGDGNKRISISENDPLWALMMGFEHEKIHLETSSVLFRELPAHLLRKPEYFVPMFHDNQSSRVDKDPVSGRDFPENEMLPVSGATAYIGKERDFPSFGWDNEYGRRSVNVPNFKASKYMVSNGEFYEFVASGGYRDEQYWTKDGWGWRVFRNQKWPFFWEQRGPAGSHEYGLRTIFEVIDMPWSWPVNVNYHEATAFTNWKHAQKSEGECVAPLRLVTEAEHQLLREAKHRNPLSSWKTDPTLNCGGKSFSKEEGANLNLVYGSETPVDYHPANENGFHDVLGNAWEWAEDDFNYLDGFKVHPYYDDFSSPCFDGEHTMILGGSFISCGDAGANLYCRYHFRPHFLQHSGFRYVEPSVPEKNIKGENIATHLGAKANLHDKSSSASLGQGTYETDVLVNQYLALHYGQTSENADDTVRSHAGRPDHALDFPKRSAEILFEAVSKAGSKIGPDSRALDIGCAVGGATFALAEQFGQVLGLEYSKAFVDQANRIRETDEEYVKFQVPVQGDVMRDNIFGRVPTKEVRSRTSFVVGDACNLPSVETLGGRFDGVLMANLLCRLHQPLDCLNGLSRIVNSNGVVMLLSPYSWLKEFTPKENWLQSDSQDSADVLRSVMEKQGFEQILSKDVPLIIREHERKYQYIVSHATGFAKRD
uniref:Sulfatase-modifying factor enzyme domain-containing protein n=1 Tax=Aplanochytrium stocchinoi TaxID=215587 RepID=A0A7S3PIU0_9STRA|mmetsp:Transcript_4000/g.5328  ORF Transcript_4000/g.5328 Transcript_4000/m.5328 type:complete len:914 (+) Transcript_4000:310-3051(+)|eukprot:CAMPEP_0204824226 /NCGR_PEP_ID=MMETSP1346-20131115/2259_1 /ASSEMBLY_ACC=CAM_ASM_000771 /TAXON_ID=215587 /ORGANISM="Aplanochytrium stocchinoi, Strain GSBS06" /LENGTH=913 /DNA_ID=CAMNT_0051951255 /DNA_START=350 /DNA_END=3091 /DNA_ORIENTATION=-